MGFKYVSIDIETGGLSAVDHDVLEVGAVFDDLSNIDVNTDRSNIFHAYIVRNTYRTQPTAAAMHERIWRIIRDKKDPQDPDALFLEPQHFASTFQDWLFTVGADVFPSHHISTSSPLSVESQRRSVLAACAATINVLGKNFASFDDTFLVNLPDFRQRIHIRKRIADPAILFLRPNDETLPDLRTCKERSKMFGDVSHSAVEDALDTIKVFRYGLNLSNRNA